MVQPSWRSLEPFRKLEETREHNRTLREQRLRQYVQANLDEKDRVLRVVAPGLMEDIAEEIREWFRMFHTRVKKFHPYPTIEMGGSIIIIRGETLTPEQWVIDEEKKRLEKLKAKGKKEDKSKLQELKRKEAEKKKKEKEKAKKLALAFKKMEESGEFEYTMPKLETIDQLKLDVKKYHATWDLKPFAENPKQKHYMDMISVDRCYEMQLEVRSQVDELMRIELTLLQIALAADIAIARGKKPKKPKIKKEKPKKEKKSKDPIFGRTIEELFQEFVDHGIIHTYPFAKFSDFKGDLSYKNYELRKSDLDPPTTVGDVRRTVIMNCVLPLTAKTMVKPKSVLIVGHRQSGKHVLANAIFNETRCVLFDVSPPIMAGKYNSQKEMKIFVCIINKLARVLQPSIIFIDGGEKPFYKKVPKEEKETQPKKMAKVLLKQIINTILPEDRVLVLAITRKPFESKGSNLVKTFQKVILIPRIDYGTVFMYWQELIMKCHAVDRNFNVTQLAHFTKNYPLPQIKEIFEKLMTVQRITQLSFKPLDAHEILEILIDAPEPITDKEWTPIEKWFNKSPLAKRRGKVIKALAEIREKEKKKK